MKPFEPEDLLARVQAQVRRRGAGPTAPTVFRSGDVEIDLRRRLVTRGGEAVVLTPIEDRILILLASNPGRLLTHAEIVGEIWRGRRSVDVRTRLRATVVSLRRELGEAGSEQRPIFADPGLGYRWIGPQDVVADGPLDAGGAGSE